MLNNAPVAAVLPAVDLDRAREFYTNKLGLKENSNHMDESTTMFEAGKGTMLVVYQRPQVKVEHTQAGFMVDDIETEVDKLRDKGVVFEDYDMPGLKTINHIATSGMVKSAWFKDSEGNILALNQMMK